MSILYRVAYQLGFKPWEEAATHPAAAEHQRTEVGREVTAVTTENATLLMLAWKPGRRGPFPRGASRVDIQAAYPGWDIVDERPFDATGLPRPLRNVDPRSYRLLRRA